MADEFDDNARELDRTVARGVISDDAISSH